jgi:type I restriction enzyme M protein
MDKELRSKLDQVTNILFAGGLANPITYIEQLSYLIYLKMLDEMESKNELQARLGGATSQLFPKQAVRYRWSEWRFKSGNELLDFVRDEVFSHMASLHKESPRIAEYFKDARLEIDDPHVLKEVIDVLDSIELEKLGTDVKGDIFEYLLQYLSGTHKSDLGQYRTPRQIRLMMVKMMDPEIGDTIYDPACGTGGFLIDAVEYILGKYSSEPREIPIYGENWLEKRGGDIEALKKENPNLQTYLRGLGDKIPDWGVLEKSIYGVDVARQMMRIAVMNLVLHDVAEAKIKRGNPLSEISGLTDEDVHRKYKVILSNPPFAGTLPKESIRSDLPSNARKSELLFLSLMQESLAPGGRCAVVVPDGVLFGSSGPHVELRKRLLEEFELLAVISLPAGVFKPYSGVKTAVLIFRRPPEGVESQLDKVWFYDIGNDGYDPDKISGGGRTETPDGNEIPAALAYWALYRSSQFTDPPGCEGNTILDPDSEEPQCWWVSKERIRERDYNLGASSYKPTVREAVVEEDVLAILSDEIIASEEKLIKGYKALEKQLREK